MKYRSNDLWVWPLIPAEFTAGLVSVIDQMEQGRISKECYDRSIKDAPPELVDATIDIVRVLSRLEAMDGSR